MSRKAGSKWTEEEDVKLCQIWLDVSQDPITSDNQKGDAFWKSITEGFNRAMSYSQEEGRSLPSLKNRFSPMSRDVAKFIGLLKKVEEMNESGKTDEDRFNDACVMFKELSKEEKPFKFKHAWKVLKGAPKWMAQYGNSDKKKRAASPVGACSADEGNILPTSETSGTRPIGIKKAKKQMHDKESKEKQFKEQLKASKEIACSMREKNKLLKQANMLKLAMHPSADKDLSTKYIRAMQLVALQEARAICRERNIPTTEDSTDDDSDDSVGNHHNAMGMEGNIGSDVGSDNESEDEDKSTSDDNNDESNTIFMAADSFARV